ncbi:uncharacterized protein EAE97_010862 [Botrytis byssoidea]|uniref:Uncharacterized protein n=1 Tax=Botrytis byssoidea TaxID=139641 RepID=A0A9P5I2Q4_9HELO|nr:uncharacterized protein EAE97_010862 [Botrytis byssoidea]KAF7923424.1 hypothetical protein EAE97_010862 [Botrytis byssoidea]
MASNVNNGSGQVERRVTRSGQVPNVRSQSENRRNRNSQVAAVANEGEDDDENPPPTPAPRSRASRNAPRSQRDTRDAFTRMIAPTLQIDRYKLELEDLNFEEGFDVGVEVKDRERGIGNGDKILEASRRAVTWIESQIKSYGSITEKRAEKMKKYQKLLSTLSVKVQILLERLLVERQGHIIDLTRKNEGLLTQVGILTGKITDLTQNSSTTNIECNELKEFLQENLSALKLENEENIEMEAISNLRKQHEQSLYRNEEISRQKGRNQELKNAALVSAQAIQQLREQVGQPSFHRPLRVNTTFSGQSHAIQQSPEPLGFIAPQSPYGESARLQQPPSSPSTTSGFQSFPSYGYIGPPFPAFPFDESHSPQFPAHSPAFGQPSSSGYGLNSGSPPTYPTSMQPPARQSPSHTPGLNSPPGFEQSNPPPMQGQFGKFKLQPSPANAAYKFLISGGVEGGVTTLNVPPELNQKMTDQITKWSKSSKASSWFQVTPVSRTRCVHVRLRNIAYAVAPATSNNGDKFACLHCMNRGLLCVLVGRDGPVIAPLNLRERLPGATPQSPGII